MRNKRTDYSKIAEVYDDNPVRSQIDPDPEIQSLLSKKTGTICVLDLACGTANYIAEQRRMFPSDRIQWHGLDLSREMLEQARKKLPDVDFFLGNAEELPYRDGDFDLVVCRFAFHHIENKRGAVSEVHRVLRTGGVFIMQNVCPEKMSRWWIHHYFPETVIADRGRFWSADRIFAALDEQGFDVRISISCDIERFDLSKLLQEAENRDASQLTMIDGEAYRSGLARMRTDRISGGSFQGDFALLSARAVNSTGSYSR